MRATLALFALTILITVAAPCQQFAVLHAFTGGSDGGGLWGSVALDRQGNVYGTTSGGGAYDGGTVFELTPEPGGSWSETVLHSFPSSPDDGAGPWGGPILDPAGNLFGGTLLGGAYHTGTAFELTHAPGGWNYVVIYTFGEGPGDYGCGGWGSLLIDGAGKLYGTCYAAFELSPGPDGWSESILHVFAGKNGDGYDPVAGPIMDGAGNLYGTTSYGGGRGGCISYGCGTVYQLQRTAAGVSVWRERILHRFGSFVNDGLAPGSGQLAIDGYGSLYGATLTGGTTGYGTIYKLARSAAISGGGWVETILYNFSNGADGSFPVGVIFDHAGNLYGTTAFGGSPFCGCGVVFKLAPQADGTWQYGVVHTFVGSDGAQPAANLTIGPDGNLYGTTATGGAGGYGVVFQIQIAQ